MVSRLIWIVAGWRRRCKFDTPTPFRTVMMRSLWTSTTEKDWRAALDRYTTVVDGQGVARLSELDRWYRDELPGLVAQRRKAHVTLSELIRLTEWKMARGVWRAPNLILVRSNAPEAVVETSRAALAAAPHP